jgi:hypothetical protein
MKGSLQAGAISGVAGLLVFLVIHNYWIMPIWFIFPIGLVIASMGGLAVGWAYNELLPNLPPRPWSIISWTALISLILLPSIILAEIRAPMFDVSVPEAMLMMSLERAAATFILELLVTATFVGGLAGWFISRTRRAMLSTALAGFVFALGPGHNIPFLGSTPGSVKGEVILMVIVLVSTVVLVETQARLSNRVIGNIVLQDYGEP